MLTEVWPFVERSRAAGVPVVLARLVDRDGPGSRPLGATMAVAADGTWRGSLSGGCVEGIVRDEALAVLERGGSRLITVSPGDHLMPWEEAPACGGVLHVLLTPAPPPDVAAEISAALAADRPIAVGVELAAPWSWRTSPSLPGLAAADPVFTVMPVTGPVALAGTPVASPGASAVADAVAASGTPAVADPVAVSESSAVADPVLNPDSSAVTEPVTGSGSSAAMRAAFAGLTAGGGAFVEELRPGPRLIVAGATDLATALAALGRTSGRRVEVVDPRPAHARPDMFPGASVVSRSWPDAWLAAHPPTAADAVLAIAHDPRIDDRTLRAALPGSAGYVGVLGSRPTHARRLDRLAGVPGLDRLSGPAGLDLGGSSVAETALSILAEVVAAAHGRRGGRLAEVSSPIRAAGTVTPGADVRAISGGDEVPMACAL